MSKGSNKRPDFQSRGTWAWLLRHVFQVDVVTSKCSGRFSITRQIFFLFLDGA